MPYRTDDNNNPAAFTTAVALLAGLVPGRDFVPGTPFPSPSKLITAKLIGDPIALTIKVIDAIGYYTAAGGQRWDYIAMPKYVWESLSPQMKRDVVGFHYKREGGTIMRGLFVNYNKV